VGEFTQPVRRRMVATPEALHLLQVKELSRIVITGDYRWGRATEQDYALVSFQFQYWIVEVP
jgi:hypothetical protein